MKVDAPPSRTGRTPEDVVGRYQRRVYAVIYRMTGRHPEVDDLCQETFLQVLRSAPRLAEGNEMDGWVYRIAMNVSVNWLRSKERDRGISDRLAAEGGRMQPRPAGPSELERAAGMALEQLPAEQKAVVVMRMFEELGHADIAAVLGVPVATVRWRLFAARRKLEEMLRPYL